MSLIKFMPIEIYIKIYKFINPISVKYPIKKKILFCIKSGEILKNGDWFLNLEEQVYMVYECIECGEENIFYNNKDCDIILNQETQ